MISPSPAAVTFEKAMAKLAAGELQLARRLMKKAAEAGHLPALRQHAYFVEFGVAGKPSIRKAMRWFERAATLKDAASCIRLAEWHFVEGHVPQAKYWLGQAGSDPHAMLMLTYLYARNRSLRATDKAEPLLARVTERLDELMESERETYEHLAADLKARDRNLIISQKLIRRVERRIAATVMAGAKQSQ